MTLTWIHSIKVVQLVYDAEITKEYVMRGNAAVMRCLIPSFVADFVVVDSWVDDEGKEFFRDKNNDDGTVTHISMISPSSHPQ